MQTKAMSTGFSLASRCASVTWSARTGTENSATSIAWVTRSPCLRMCSTCSGQGSMKVTSSPACTMWAPAYAPTAPAPTIAILRAMLPPDLASVGGQSSGSDISAKWRLCIKSGAVPCGNHGLLVAAPLAARAQPAFAPGITPPRATVSSAATSLTVCPNIGRRSSVRRLVMPETEIAAKGSAQSL
ncbi:hypothetical protein V1290_006480 [Bradyrhizobium sp. AZCC 1578]